MKVSVLIPCYNEEENIQECIKKINLPYDHEMIVVDDGSIDKTTEKAKEIKRPNLKVVRYEKNQGKGNAVKVGISNSSGDIIVIQDADMATSPEELSKVLNPILEGKADFVNGTRFVYPMKKRAMRKLRIIGNKIYAKVISLVIGVNLTDTLCGFKAFNIKKFKNFELEEKSWPDFELIFKAKKNGLKIVEVPIHYEERKGGKTKMKILKDGLNFWRMIIKNVINFYFR